MVPTISILNCIRKHNGNQCSSRSISVMCAIYLAPFLQIGVSLKSVSDHELVFLNLAILLLYIFAIGNVSILEKANVINCDILEGRYKLLRKIMFFVIQLHLKLARQLFL